MTKKPNVQEGGIKVRGNVYADKVAARDIIDHSVTHGLQEIDFKTLFGTLNKEIALAPAAVKSEAAQKMQDLEKELQKGDEADDGITARLIQGLVGLVPAAVSAVVTAFANPILAGLVGPVTKIVLDGLQGSSGKGKAADNGNTVEEV
jgi:hypothetical protein